jgi:hypothetical protein
VGVALSASPQSKDVFTEFVSELARINADQTLSDIGKGEKIDGRRACHREARHSIDDGWPCPLRLGRVGGAEEKAARAQSDTSQKMTQQMVEIREGLRALSAAEQIRLYQDDSKVRAALDAYNLAVRATQFPWWSQLSQRLARDQATPGKNKLLDQLREGVALAERTFNAIARAIRERAPNVKSTAGMTMTRIAFDRRPLSEKMAAAKAGVKLTD